MNTDRELMQQALEALKSCSSVTHYPVLQLTIKALRERLAQPEQEPVAWMWRCKPYCNWPEWSVSLKRPADSGRDGNKRTEGYEDAPLYTTPQPRQWVGLTDDEVAVMMMEAWGCASIAPRHAPAFAQAIEAKLREKNT